MYVGSKATLEWHKKNGESWVKVGEGETTFQAGTQYRVFIKVESWSPAYLMGIAPTYFETDISGAQLKFHPFFEIVEGDAAIDPYNDFQKLEAVFPIVGTSAALSDAITAAEAAIAAITVSVDGTDVAMGTDWVLAL